MDGELKGPTWEACATKGKVCVGWVERYFKDCLCSARDDASFALGLASLVFWAVAEIPQLVTNFKNKSAHGISLALLLTWVVGDIFNLVGCLLEPATLPTQLYTALLYTIITVVLVLQTLYYDYYIKWRKCGDFGPTQKGHKDKGDKWKPEPSPPSPSAPIPTTAATPLISSSAKRDMYYTSARSLANSGTPPYVSSYLRTARTHGYGVRSGPPEAALLHDSSSEDEESNTYAPPTRRGRGTKLSRSAGYGTFLAASAANLLTQTKAMTLVGGKLLVETSAGSSTAYGVWLGWIMAAIYMGGRLPQIILNIKRGSVEGLNPFMFLFALIANVTYVGSILARSVELKRIKANAPWLLDAVVCVLLDMLIIMQFGYYKFMHRGRTDDEEDDEYSNYYAEVEKPQA